MAQMPPPFASPISGTIEHTGQSAVVNTPHPAELIHIDSRLEHKRHVVAVTEQHGLQVKELEYDAQLLHPHPYRISGERTVTDLDSFLAELARRPLGDAATLWGTASRGRLTAIYNDHRYIGDEHDGDDIPGWRDDKLTLALTPDED